MTNNKLRAAAEALVKSADSGGIDELAGRIADLRQALRDADEPKAERTTWPGWSQGKPDPEREPIADPVEQHARANFNLSHGIVEGVWDKQPEQEKERWRFHARQQLNRRGD